ncbi:MAG TPA: 2-phospho-L-lactate guanylyltransferase [Thermoleophilaceae bacterium]|nr:2-phospho-L-lactate guanylyltransferase [Thermoleophilaceae bacterium]
MRTLAILPIKSFGSAKQRLSALLGQGSREALAQAMFSDVLGSLRRVKGLDAIAVVTDDARAESAARGGRVQVLRDRAETGQSDATLIGIRHALSCGFERALLVPGDTPLVDPLEVDGMLTRAAAERLAAVIVPDRDGAGTNALLLRPADLFEPSFGPGSLERHVEAAAASGERFQIQRVRSLMHDVDTPDDLADLGAVLDERRGVAPRTRGALNQLDRSKVCGPTARRRPVLPTAATI